MRFEMTNIRQIGSDAKRKHTRDMYTTYEYQNNWVAELFRLNRMASNFQVDLTFQNYASQKIHLEHSYNKQTVAHDNDKCC